jgi:hypothetical protein
MKVRFHPQICINEEYSDIIIKGAYEHDFEVEDTFAGVESDTIQSDGFQHHSNAPAWIQNWNGPFWFEVLKNEHS